MNENREDSQGGNDDKIACNVYIHPLCGFLNGYEVWAEEDKKDCEKEKTIEESAFERLDHFMLLPMFHCHAHAVTPVRDYEA